MSETTEQRIAEIRRFVADALHTGNTFRPQTVAFLLAELDEANRLCASLREEGEADKARLDWLDEQDSYWLASTGRATITFPVQSSGVGADIRHTIDAARSIPEDRGDAR